MRLLNTVLTSAPQAYRCDQQHPLVGRQGRIIFGLSFCSLMFECVVFPRSGRMFQDVEGRSTVAEPGPLQLQVLLMRIWRCESSLPAGSCVPKTFSGLAPRFNCYTHAAACALRCLSTDGLGRAAQPGGRRLSSHDRWIRVLGLRRNKHAGVGSVCEMLDVHKRWQVRPVAKCCFHMRLLVRLDRPASRGQQFSWRTERHRHA